MKNTIGLLLAGLVFVAGIRAGATPGETLKSPVKSLFVIGVACGGHVALFDNFLLK